MTPLETVAVNGQQTGIVNKPFSTPITTTASGTFDDNPLGSCFGPPIPTVNQCVTDQQTFSMIYIDGNTYPISTVSTSRQCVKGISLSVTGNPIGLDSSFSIGTVN